MIRCKNCGFDQNPDNAKECDKCGAELVRLCSCGFELKPHWVKCPKCKKPVTEEGKGPQKCSCGEPLEDWMDECPACGKAVSKGTAAKAQLAAGMDTGDQKNTPEVQACLDRGLLFASRGDYVMAIKEFSEVINLDPNLFMAYVLRGKAVMASICDVNNSAEDFDKLLFSGLRKDAPKERVDDAIDDYNQAIRINPDYAVAYLRRGAAHGDIGDYDQAIADYTQAVRLDPKYVNAYGNRANAYFAKGSYDLATKDYSKALQLDPEYVAAFYSRGLSYQNQEEYNLSINDFTEAIRLSPSFAIAYQQRGFSYYLQDDADSAIRDCTKAIGLDPGESYNYFLRGLCYGKKEKYGAAIQDFSKAIKINSNDYHYYKKRGDAYNDDENYNKAVSDFTQAIEMSKKDDAVSREEWAYLFNGRGYAWANLENKEMALADFEQAVELDPSVDLYRENRDKFKGCFITTAVCQSFSKPDDCYELTAFRDFRDNWLAKQPEGEAIIKRYYTTAPQIVSAINRRVDKDAVYLEIWNEYLAECLRLIEAGKLEDCKQLYVQMVENLENGFCVEEER